MPDSVFTVKSGKFALPSLLSLNHLTSPLGGIHRAGFQKASQGHTARSPRTLGLYAAVYLIEGEGWFGQHGKRRRRISAGDLIHILPEVSHFYHPREGTTWAEFHIVYEGTAFDALRQEGLFSDSVWRLTPVEYWLHRMYETVAPANQPTARIVSPSSGLKLLARWQEFLADACETWTNSRSGRQPGDLHWIRAVETALYPGSLPIPSPAAVARSLGLSHDAFRKKFFSLKKISPSGYQQRRRIHAACELLSSENCLVKEVAERLGFSDAYHFSKRFRTVMGFPPSVFKRQLSQTKI